MTAPFTFRPASRSEAKPLIGLHGLSGCGKTYSALLLARGFVGPEGKVGMIETEAGRGESYADPVEYPELKGPGAANYDVLPLREEFSAQTYGLAITAAEKAGIQALIIDSASHEWEGVGGVLDAAEQNRLHGGYEGKGLKGVLVWQKPKMDHAKHFLMRFMQTPIDLVILCMRSRYPMEERDKRGGGKEWVRSTDLNPKQDDAILFEMFVHGWIGTERHEFHVGKCTNRALLPVFDTGGPITLETGQRLAEWAGGGRVLTTDVTPAEVYEQAAAAAAKGRGAFMEWWNGPGKAKVNTKGDAARFLIKDRTEDLERIVAGRESQSPPDEDPFGLPPLEEPRPSGRPMVPGAPPADIITGETGEDGTEPSPGAKRMGPGERAAAIARGEMP